MVLVTILEAALSPEGKTAIHPSSLSQQHYPSPGPSSLTHLMVITTVCLFALAIRKLRAKYLESIWELKASMEEMNHSLGFVFFFLPLSSSALGSFTY